MKTIVIIEDDTDTQEIYYDIFSPTAYRISFAASGSLGIKLVQKEKPDLVILDMLLPGTLNGMAVLTTLKTTKETKHIPIIVVTNLESEKQTALRNGASDFLVKSKISVETLLQKTSAFLKENSKKTI